MKYKYQMHTHTLPCSKCAAMSHVDLLSALVEGGYNGCVLTNHFYNGNTAIDRNLPWEIFVAQYEEDYNTCKNIAQKYNLDVIFGIEEHLVDGLEILCYGITPEFLYNNPQLHKERDIYVWYKALHDFGALCIQAHPFRDRAYIKNPRLLPSEYIDGIEVFNACNTLEDNKKAEDCAKEHPEWILVSGADAHTPSSVCWSGIETDIRIIDEYSLLKVLKSRDYELII